jgi:hypothetical protein
MIDAGLRRVAAIVWVLILVANAERAVAADASRAAKGDKWETTSKMTMDGMPDMPGMQGMPGMAASTQTQCSPKVWTQPPGGGQERGCKNSDMNSAGNTVTWKVTCPDMTGIGEITRSGADAYAGTIKFTSPQGGMTLHLTGKKVGECDNPQ